MTQDWSERFLTHYVEGAWRAPLSEVLAPTRHAGRSVVIAGPADLARALGAARAAAQSWRDLEPERRRALLAPVWRAGQGRAWPVSRQPVLLSDPADGSLGALVGSALTAGNVAIVLGSPADPEPAFRFVDACHDAQVPRGVIGLLYALDHARTAAAMGLTLGKA
jgi:acyl-CoA reductase-like NAD-dependent aldehyde dehydrogenase